MKRLFVILLASLLLLSSCRKLEDENIPDAPETEVYEDIGNGETTVPEPEETTDADTTEAPVTLPSLIGFYDDLENNGNYSRINNWKEPWIQGKDIAVFDIIPSGEGFLFGQSYKKLWKNEYDKNFRDSLAKPSFVLEFILDDGTVKTFPITSYADAEKVNDSTYLEVYLYDDIHQEDGKWYYHLTKDTTNDETVISSFKLTAGENIADVISIKLTAKIDGSADAIVSIANGG